MASFGILLLQDLVVVPLLVVVELLARGYSTIHSLIHTYIHTYIKCTYRRGAGLGRALAVAGVKALVTLSAMSIIGYTYMHTYIHTYILYS